MFLSGLFWWKTELWFYEGEENLDALWYYMFVFQNIRLLRIKPGLGQFGSWGLYSRCCKDNRTPSLRDLPRSTQIERKADAYWFQGIPLITKKSLHSLLALKSHTVFCWMLLLWKSQFGGLWEVLAGRWEQTELPLALGCVWNGYPSTEQGVRAHKQEISFLSFPQWIFPKILPTDQACLPPSF